MCQLLQDRPSIPPTWHRIGPIGLGHGPKRTVVFNPDLIFLRSGLKLAEHKPWWWQVFAQDTPNIGPAEPPSDPTWAHPRPMTWFRIQLLTGLSNTRAKNVQDSPSIGSIFRLMPSIAASETESFQKPPRIHKRYWTNFCNLNLKKISSYACFLLWSVLMFLGLWLPIESTKCWTSLEVLI